MKRLGSNVPIWVKNTDGPVTPAQLARLFAILREHGLDREDLADIIFQANLESDLHLLSRREYDQLCDELIPSFGRLSA